MSFEKHITGVIVLVFLVLISVSVVSAGDVPEEEWSIDITVEPGETVTIGMDEESSTGIWMPSLPPAWYLDEDGLEYDSVIVEYTEYYEWESMLTLVESDNFEFFWDDLGGEGVPDEYEVWMEIGDDRVDLWDQTSYGPIELGDDTEIEIIAGLEDLERPDFEIEIIDVNDPIVEGEDLEVKVSVTNEGNVSDSQDIILRDFDGNIVDEIFGLSLGAGESEEVELVWNTEVGDAGSGDLVVESEDDSDSINATISEEDAPAIFEIEDLRISPEIVEMGETVTIEVDLINNGDETGEREVELLIEESLEETRSVELAGDESTTITFETTREEEGEYEIVVDAQDDSLIDSFFVEKDVLRFDLSVGLIGDGSIVVDGETVTDDSTFSFEDGEEVTVEAIPDEGYEFVEWTGDVESVDDEISVVMDYDKSITAVFEEVTEEHELVIEVDGGGTTNPMPGTHVYEEGTEVIVEAISDPNWEFVEWVGDYEGTDDQISFFIEEDTSLVASFEEELEPADLVIEDFELSEEIINPGQFTEVEVSVFNDGEMSGEQDLEVIVNDEVEYSDDIILDGGESRSVTYEISREETGEYEVVVRFGEQTVSSVFEVREENGFPWTILILIFVVVSIMVVGYWFWTQSDHKEKRSGGL